MGSVCTLFCAMKMAIKQGWVMNPQRLMVRNKHLAQRSASVSHKGHAVKLPWTSAQGSFLSFGYRFVQNLCYTCDKNYPTDPSPAFIWKQASLSEQSSVVRWVHSNMLGGQKVRTLIPDRCGSWPGCSREGFNVRMFSAAAVMRFKCYCSGPFFSH